MNNLLVDNDVTTLSGLGRHGYGEAGQTDLRGKALLRRHLSLLLLIIPVLLLAWQEDDSLQVGGQPDSIQVGEQPDTLAVLAPDTTLGGLLFHNPPVAILNDRPFRVDFFVDFDPEDIESVGLFIKGDSSHTYREIPLTGEHGHYQHQLPVEELRGGALTYYFLVTLKDYGLWAYPKDEQGRIRPFVVDLVPPTKEFFQKRYYD